MHRFAAALIFVLLAAPVAGAATTGATGPVLLKTKVIIDESVVRLGDIFDGLSEQAETAVARAPAPGKRVEVGARWLTAVAQAYGLPWRPSSRLDTTVIERASLVIDTRRIEDATLAALAQRGVKGNVTLLLDNPTLRLHLPSDADSTIAITGLSHDPQTGRFKAYVTAPAEGIPIARAMVTGRAVAMTEVPVLRRRIEPGEIIRHEDIDWLRVRTDHLARNALVDVEGLLGKSPRRPIRAGQPVLSGELRKP
ncbi:MAG: flagella basal body P-ring formation protein FlgA, partial [Planctomycetota bacterium]|nr:flagella basal body P-ring formation protein FlgA [Planctomycetota bacterium]